jgi:hypothetical protein
MWTVATIINLQIDGIEITALHFHFIKSISEMKMQKPTRDVLTLMWINRRHFSQNSDFLQVKSRFYPGAYWMRTASFWLGLKASTTYGHLRTRSRG